MLVPFEEIFAGKQLKTAQTRLHEVLAAYRRDPRRRAPPSFDQYRFVDAAHKVVGVGSVGTRAWVALFVGRDEDDPLFLQVKEAQPSVLEPFTAPTEFPHQGQRVVEGQRLTQSSSDIMLGWLSAVGPDARKRDFYVRQLWDRKGSAQVETMPPRAMSVYAQICGGILARAHARSRRSDRDRLLPRQQRQLRPGDDRVSPTAYADQNERDYAALQPRSRTGVSRSSGRLIDGRPTLFGPLTVEKEGVQAI